MLASTLQRTCCSGVTADVAPRRATHRQAECSSSSSAAFRASCLTPRCTSADTRKLSVLQRSSVAGKVGRLQQVMATAAPNAGVRDTSSLNGSGALEKLNTQKVIGILGGGQLGKMLAQAGARMGLKIKVLDPQDSCSAHVVAEHVLGDFREAEAVKKFAEGVDILTVEIEHIDTAGMQAVADSMPHVDVQPQPATLRTIQDKYAQKVHFSQAAVPLSDFLDLPDQAALEGAAKEFGFPLMLKAKRNAYDGRGNAVAKTAEGLESAVASLGGFANGLYAEKWVPFECEVAVMVARSRGGEIKSFPVVQTIHRDNICHTTEAPARVPASIQAEAQRIAEQAVAALEGAGVFGVEMFLLKDGTLLLNEVAPRPHNSGHFTIEACATSQYEQHLRAISGLPLGDTSLLCGSSIMLNLLGEADGPEGRQIAEQQMQAAYRVPGAAVHWYGKEDVRKARKVGHVTICAATPDEARARLGAINPAALEAMKKEAYVPAAEASKFGTAKVAIIMGSDSDLPTMAGAAQVLEEFGVECDVTVVSAHRTPEKMVEFARTAHKRGVKVIIAGAGGAAHLPGMVAAMTPLPVIGVPVKPAGAYLDGMDALLSIVQMPKGVPVATVAIGNSANAGLLALRILATQDPATQEAMVKYQSDMREMVDGKAARLEAEGWKAYLAK